MRKAFPWRLGGARLVTTLTVVPVMPGEGVGTDLLSVTIPMTSTDTHLAATCLGAPAAIRCPCADRSKHGDFLEIHGGVSVGRGAECGTFRAMEFRTGVRACRRGFLAEYELRDAAGGQPAADSGPRRTAGADKRGADECRPCCNTRRTIRASGHAAVQPRENPTADNRSNAGECAGRHALCSEPISGRRHPRTKYGTAKLHDADVRGSECHCVKCRGTELQRADHGTTPDRTADIHAGAISIRRSTDASGQSHAQRNLPLRKSAIAPEA